METRASPMSSNGISYSDMVRPIRFYCKFCQNNFVFDDSFEDPTTGSGACKCCGSKEWMMYTLEGSPI